MGRLTWPYYLTLMIGQAEQLAAQYQEPEELDPVEQAILQQDALAILRGDTPISSLGETGVVA